MNPEDYEFICKFLLSSSGLTLGSSKEYLVTSRLVPIAQSWGLANLEELVSELRRGEPLLKTAVTEAMTTNESSFFRDKKPFDELKSTLLPALIQERQTTKTLRIWSAAASTGQESYSIAMLIADNFPQLNDWNIQIFSTDISQKALDRAADGSYTQFEIQRGLPIQILMKHFEQVPNGWQVKQTLRDQITWKHINLLEPFAHFQQFDIIFCRNVLIYFEIPRKKDILDRMQKVVRKDGYLILGAAETVLGISDSFTRYKECKAAVYKPADAAVVASV